MLEADLSCKTTYTETGRQRSCAETAGKLELVAVPGSKQPKPISSNHYLAGVIAVPAKSLRLHLREFDTAATSTTFVAGHAVEATLAQAACEPSDRPATSIAD